MVHVTLPDEAGRLEVLRIHTRQTPLASDAHLEEIATRTAGYSGAELAALTREAALGALEEDGGAEVVARRHLEAALAMVTPRTSAETLAFFSDWERRCKATHF